MKESFYVIIGIILFSIVLFLSNPSFWIFLSFICSFYFLYMCVRGLKNKKLMLSIWFLAMFVLALQLSSVAVTGTNIVPLTIMNLGESSAIGWGTKAKIILVFFVVSIFAVFMPLVMPKKNKSSGLIALIMLSLFVVCFPGPLSGFLKSSASAYNQFFFKPKLSSDNKIAELFLKDNIYGDVIYPEAIKNKQIKNVVIIFTEGMSTEVLGVKNSKALNVTPNMDKLYSEGFVVDNYFNHTAATFRGLRGQLSSSYQYTGGYSPSSNGLGQMSDGEIKDGYNNSIVSISDILKSYGYKTYFVNSIEEDSKLSLLLNTLSFDKVYGLDKFDDGVDGVIRSDRDTFGFLKKLISSQKNDDRYFVGVYPSGTHEGLDSIDKKYADGSNSYYNKFYNYDFHLGEFIDWFKSSEYFHDTLVVLTADHSTFPSSKFLDSFGMNTDHYFVDEIPLVMFGAGIENGHFDAKGANSLALAPTVLSMLGINKAWNLFLGCSLFEVNCKSEFSKISAIGDEFYSTDSISGGRYKVTPLPDQDKIRIFYNLNGS